MKGLEWLLLHWPILSTNITGFTNCMSHSLYFLLYFIYHRRKSYNKHRLTSSSSHHQCLSVSYILLRPPHNHTVPSLSAAEICFVLTSPPTPPLQLIPTFVPKLILCVHMTQIRSPRQITKHTGCVMYTFLF